MRLVTHAGDVRAECRAAKIVEGCGHSAMAGGHDDGLQRCKYALTVGLTERHQPRASGNPVRDHRVEKAMHRCGERHTMGGAHKPDGNGIDDRAVAPKWLVSRLSGVSVGAFRTSDAVKVLRGLGVEVRRVLNNGHEVRVAKGLI